MAEGVKSHKLKQQASNQERKHRVQEDSRENREKILSEREKTLLLNLCITRTD